MGLAGRDSPLSLRYAVNVTGNVTEQHVAFKGNADFSKLVGLNLTLQLRFENAALYTVGWTAHRSSK